MSQILITNLLFEVDRVCDCHHLHGHNMVPLASVGHLNIFSNLEHEEAQISSIMKFKLLTIDRPFQDRFNHFLLYFLLKIKGEFQRITQKEKLSYR